MPDLRDCIEDLHNLNEVRNRAKELREQGLRSLRRIDNTKGGLVAPNSSKGKELSAEEKKRLKADQTFLEDWVCSGNEAEVALLVHAQNHRNYSQREEDNDAANASIALTERLRAIGLSMLLPDSDMQDTDATVPVLVAARALQALTARPETVFSKASMLCYYRIIRELYYASRPDWTIGAARAGRGGRTSAFITSECIRAIFAFESVTRRTCTYFESTLNLYNRYLQLEVMLNSVGVDPASDHPLRYWADKAIERMWLDWYISVSPRNGAIALYCEGYENKLLPFPPGSPLDQDELPDINMQSIKSAFPILRGGIIKALDTALTNIGNARDEIYAHRDKELADAKNIDSKYRTESAHRMALKIINKVFTNAFLFRYTAAPIDRKAMELRELLEFLDEKSKVVPDKVHRVLEPAKRFVRTVLDRELAIAHSGGKPDAGELIFAATAFGTVTNWLEDDKLKQACNLLVEALPDNGRFATNRPFHADRRGYKLLPIGCEMTRSFAKLLYRTHYEFEPNVARRMLNVFLNEKQFFRRRDGCAGWNFENAPDGNQPYVWVTAIAVQALDRIVRMLNDRINEIVFKHFKVVRPERPHADLTLNMVIYPDYGLMSEYYGKRAEGKERHKNSIAIRLEQMRAHVMRASLPRKYKEDQEGGKEKVFSAILYGPPGTGKTSLLEALALSSNVPLVMLSPSDLIVQGREQLEGRARAVFNALSMLTQAVILLDEFEPVLYRRVPRPNKDGDHRGATVEGGDSTLKFLLTGMLPKLISLHDAAEEQSLVYCLATNHLEEIDDAAKRVGRFDVHQPIYNPDPISRAGTFLFRLQPIAKELGRERCLSNAESQYIFANIVASTANENAGELSRRFFKQPKLVRGGLSDSDKKWSSFTYVLGIGTDSDWFEVRLKEVYDNFNRMDPEFQRESERLDEKERLERDWLSSSERELRERLREVQYRRNNNVEIKPEEFLK